MVAFKTDLRSEIGSTVQPMRRLSYSERGIFIKSREGVPRSSQKAGPLAKKTNGARTDSGVSTRVQVKVTQPHLGFLCPVTTPIITPLGTSYTTLNLWNRTLFMKKINDKRLTFDSTILAFLNWDLPSVISKRRCANSVRRNAWAGSFVNTTRRKALRRPSGNQASNKRKNSASRTVTQAKIVLRCNFAISFSPDHY